MPGLQLAGLASGFDWKTLVDNLMQLERTPIARLESERTLNERKTTALASLNTRLADLKTASAALKGSGLFNGRAVASTTTNSNWLTSASAGTAAGNYSFDILQLATTTRRIGASDLGQGISATDDVSAVTLATLPTSTTVTAGKFTVNGVSVNIELTDSLQDVFAKISTATGGAVTASYSAATDKINLTGASEIVLGAANDTSNFLSVARLANNGTDTVASGTALGSTSTNVPLANARLRTAVTAVDGTGAGTFAINGVSIDYNLNTDSLSNILSKINGSSAGVSASYDSASDRVILANKTTGDTGLSIQEGAGGLMGALGLATGSTLDRGKNARFTINGGPELTSTSNTLDGAAHGIAGLAVTARTESEQTISVTANTASMRTAIDSFIAKFNAVQSYIDEQTKVTSSNGRVTAALMSSNREIQEWSRTLRTTAFGSVSGLNGTVKRLDDLGIDFASGAATLNLKDSSKLEAALLNNADDVEKFFNQASTGFGAKFETFVNNTIGITGTGGTLGSQTTTLTKSSASIADQIAAIERRLVQKRAQLEAGFIAMETAQSNLQRMQEQIANAFGSGRSSK